MNILIFSWRGPGHPNAGGAEESTHQHAKAWVRDGHSVTLFTSRFKGAKVKDLIDGVSIIRYGNQVLGTHMSAFFWYLFKKNKKFDLVIDQFHGIPFFTPLYVRTKKMGFIHELTKEVWMLNQLPLPFNLLVAFIGKFIEPFIFKLYAKVPFMTVSDSTRDELVEWGIKNKDIYVIHNGVNLSSIAERINKEKKKTLIFLGTLSKDKGVEDALKTFSFVLNNDNKEWQFWVVGKGSLHYVNYLKKKSEDLGLKNNIKFFGYVPEKKKFELLKRAHLLINTSIKEGWGLVVIEAAVVSTPTVAFNVSGLKDSIKRDITGILVDRRDLEIMAKAICELLANHSKYQKMCKEAYKWGGSFSWSEATIKSISLIRDITD